MFHVKHPCHALPALPESPSMIDVEQRRRLYPALTEDVVYLDGPGGTQVPESVIDAVSDGLSGSMSNVGGFFPSSVASTDVIGAARGAIADLVGAEPDNVALGSSMTALTYQFADGLAASWNPGDEIIVTRLDHDANVRPWVQAAERHGLRVRWADIELSTCELNIDELLTAINGRTRLIAVTAASNVVGSCPDIPAIANVAHEQGALVYVDAVHAAQHRRVDLHGLGADFVACSVYKLFGPHVAAVAARPGLLGLVNPRRLAPAPSGPPDSFDVGTLPFELLHGLVAAVDHLASLDTGQGSRRERLEKVMSGVEDYCETLFLDLVKGLHGLDGVAVVADPAERVPTVAFRVRDQSPSSIAAALAERGVCVGHGSFYAYELMRRLDLYESGGVVRVAALHYNTAHEVERFLSALTDIVQQAASVGST